MAEPGSTDNVSPTSPRGSILPCPKTCHCRGKRAQLPWTCLLRNGTEFTREKAPSMTMDSSAQNSRQSSLLRAVSSRPPISGKTKTQQRGTSRKPPALIAAQKAAVEKSVSRYVPLLCGHGTYREIILIYSVFALTRDSVWCEKCDKWTTLRPEREKVEYPEEPLF